MPRKLFDPTRPYRVVLYLRMSSDKQNPRSPDQQEAEIRRVLRNIGCNWVVVKVYRDEGKSGRYKKNRAGLQAMMRDIRTRAVVADLILVDTLERFGRADDISADLKELREKYGVLLLTADSQFADPMTPQGRAFSAFEAMRATEENRVKAHQVLRGKRDQARRGFWPGGPRPFGFQLVTRFCEGNGRTGIEGSVLEPHPTEAAVIQLLFERARQTGHGQTRLAQFLNQSPDVQDEFKPFHGSTVGRWLTQSLYIGELRWEQDTSDVVDDSRIMLPNPEEDWLIVPGFCPPLVSQETWDAVQAVRSRRSNAMQEHDGDGRPDIPGKQIRPPAPGLSLKYMLTGLVCCGHCGASMRPVASGRKSNAGRSYTYYACPRAIDGGACHNKRHVPEEWLRNTVVFHIQQWLFAGDAGEQ